MCCSPPKPLLNFERPCQGWFGWSSGEIPQKLNCLQPRFLASRIACQRVAWAAGSFDLVDAPW